MCFNALIWLHLISLRLRAYCAFGARIARHKWHRLSAITTRVSSACSAHIFFTFLYMHMNIIIYYTRVVYLAFLPIKVVCFTGSRVFLGIPFSALKSLHHDFVEKIYLNAESVVMICSIESFFKNKMYNEANN